MKCDIRKFFASIDHGILMDILRRHIKDSSTISLSQEIIGSFSSGKPCVGLPLGNLTSQLLVNIYLNEFDQFMKHKLRAKHYIRYTDDFVILSEDRRWLETLIPPLKDFLENRLRLTLHPDKVLLKTLASGVDFLGWVNFADHRVLRTATKRRMMRQIEEEPTPAIINSYIGLLKHGNTSGLREKIIGTTMDLE